jgi:probable O-glycosylation ligase (exosortase A-associated)
MPLRAIVLIAFLVASLPVCFFRPFYGIILWIVIAFLNPQSYTWTVDAFPWAVAVAIPTMLGMLAFDRKLDRLASPQFWLISVLWIWFTVTTVVSTNTPELVHHATDTWFRWKFVSKVLLMTLCMIPIVSSFERLRRLVLTIAACFGFYVLKSFPFLILTGGVFRLYGPERSMIADNNDFGLALNMTLPVYFFLAQTERNRWVKRLFGLLFVLTIPAIFFTYSRGALVGLAALLAIMFVRSRRRFVLVPVMAIGLLIAVFVAPEAWKERMDLTRPEAIDASALSRLNAWAYARALAADYPITGGGFATFTPELFERYAPTYVENVYGPHSVYFQVLAEHGYVGLFLYLSLVLSCFVTTRRLRKAARARSDTEIAAYAQMFQFSLIGFLLPGLFLGRAYFDYYFTIVACVIILNGVARDRWQGSEIASGERVATARQPVGVAALDMR